MGTMTFAPFLSFWLLKKCEAACWSPCCSLSRSLCGGELGPWHPLSAVILPHPHPRVQRGALEEAVAVKGSWGGRPDVCDWRCLELWTGTLVPAPF